MLSIANDFSPFPAGRVPEDGPYNGRKFREDHLKPALIEADKAGEVLVVTLDGLKSCGSSFLESAFGGLVRYDGYNKKQLRSLMQVRISNLSLERYKLSIDRHIKYAVAE